MSLSTTEFPADRQTGPEVLKGARGIPMPLIVGMMNRKQMKEVMKGMMPRTLPPGYDEL